MTRPEIDDWNAHSDPPGSRPEDIRSCNSALDDWHARERTIEMPRGGYRCVTYGYSGEELAETTHELAHEALREMDRRARVRVENRIRREAERVVHPDVEGWVWSCDCGDCEGEMIKAEEEYEGPDVDMASTTYRLGGVMDADEARRFARRATDFFVRTYPATATYEVQRYPWALGALEALLAFVLHSPGLAIADMRERIARAEAKP
jgi:hypothetical protein